jgi:hypothetical protein
VQDAVIATRRGFLAGLGSLLAAPAIVHAGNLMPVKVMRPGVTITPYRSFAYALEADEDVLTVVLHPSQMADLAAKYAPDVRVLWSETIPLGTVIRWHTDPGDIVLIDRRTQIWGLPRLETPR